MNRNACRPGEGPIGEIFSPFTVPGVSRRSRKDVVKSLIFWMKRFILFIDTLLILSRWRGRMRRSRFLVVVACFAFLPVGSRAEFPRIRVVHPREGQRVQATDSTFVFGSVTPGSGLWINDVSVPILENGAFLAYLPVEAGTFRFACEAVLESDTARMERSVFIPPGRIAYPVDVLGFDTTHVLPRESAELRSGDLIEVTVKGTPGCEAAFDIEGVAWAVPMTERMPMTEFPWGEAVFGDKKPETNTLRGVYTGVYRIQPWDLCEEASIVFHLSSRGDTVSMRASGRVTVSASAVPRIAVLTDETVIARPSPGQAYAWFLPGGVRLWLTGRRGIWHRARLAQGQEAWIPEGSFRMLPAGSTVPRSIVRSIRTVSLEDRVRVRIPLGERLPFHIRQQASPSSLILTLYGAWSDTDWIPQDFSDPVIRDLRWRQAFSGVYELEIQLNQEQQWGYDTRYDGSTLELDIKRKPHIRRSVLKGITVCLDPGHHPDTGAVGPTGLEEREVNLAVATALRGMLEKRGAVVVMTREREEGIDLYTRPRLAAVVDADLLISIHFNALPDGVNPWRNNGSSTYYFHPMGSRLARSIHRAVLAELGLPDFGVYYANLALCRTTQMPAVLTEEAFMMIPEQERLLGTPEFRMRCARAILTGIERFLKEQRP